MLHSVWVLPVWVALFVPLTFFLTYCLAIYQNHVQTFVPYISDTGSYPPESCIFAQMLNIAAVCIGLVMYLRHRQIAEFYRHSKEEKREFLFASTISLWIGYVSAFGLSMVGNFQQTNWFLAHMLGASLAFGCGLIYCWAQTIFTYKMQPIGMRRRGLVAHFRLFLAVISTGCFFIMSGLGFNPFFNVAPNRKNYTMPDCLSGTWQLVFIEPGDPGYAQHIATTICEWIMSMAFMIYFMSYADELRHAILFPPTLVLTFGEADLTSAPPGEQKSVVPPHHHDQDQDHEFSVSSNISGKRPTKIAAAATAAARKESSSNVVLLGMKEAQIA